MKRRGFLYLMSGLASLAVRPGVGTCLLAGGKEQEISAGIIGMYVHQHWPYHHPYAARTWTIEDWRGFAGGLKQLGYNSIMIWPMLETMPDPLTPSDRASLKKHARVIDLLHNELGMRVMIVLCPNIVANAKAAQATYETRHYYYSDHLVNPADEAAMTKMIAWREKLFRYLAHADAVSIIDCDPGGYPGSTNAEFVTLLGEHRRMLDRIRPEVELDYWVLWGWEAWSRFYATGKLRKVEAELLDTVARFRDLNPEPWGLADGLPYAEKLGIANRVISYNYGQIEGEPSFPMTNFGGNHAYEAGAHPGPRGVMGNAQTHCVQLPNIFAFARGAAGKPVMEADYVDFANALINGIGREIMAAWNALSGEDASLMRAQAAVIRRAATQKLVRGRLSGLLFGDPARFLNDLVLQLELKAAYQDFLRASRNEVNVKPALALFASAAEAWQKQHGYQNRWQWPGLYEALDKLNWPEINSLLSTQVRPMASPEGGLELTGDGNLASFLQDGETFTPRLLSAMKKAVAALP
jgi:hypothetical protein